MAEVQHVQRQEIMKQQPFYMELQPQKTAQIFSCSKVVPAILKGLYSQLGMTQWSVHIVRCAEGARQTDSNCYVELCLTCLEFGSN